ncbi:MAG: NAD(P)H-hydrate dehydratase [Eubacterium sp.]|nr:NAD(P)H-hydrate dehydratase [Eubacterium sp.]
MKYIVTAGQMKTAEMKAVAKGIALSTLMENSGVECYKKIGEIVGGVKDKTFVVLCGRGNNGGDGIVISNLLMANGAETLCIFTGDLPISETARTIYAKYHENLNIASYSHREDAVSKALLNCDVIIDCVYGSGFHGELDPKLSTLFKYIDHNCRALKFSVDIPSGVDATEGTVSDGSFRADFTLAPGAAKTGYFSLPAAIRCGSLILLDIGIPEDCYSSFTATITESEILRFIPKRPLYSHKGHYGRLLNIAGSERYIGAALLSAKAALRSGVGHITLASPTEVCRSAAPAIPEAVFCSLIADDNGYISSENIQNIAGELLKATAVSIGPGIGNTSETAKLTEFVIKNARCPIILDADGINSIAGNINILKGNDKLKILTPHPGELARLIGVSVDEVEQNRLKYASQCAREWLSVIVLKGPNTVIATPDGRIGVNPTGNPGLAKAGSGDVLTGIIAALVAQGTSGYESALLGTYLHGLAAEKISQNTALAGVLPGDIADYLPFVMQ